MVKKAREKKLNISMSIPVTTLREGKYFVAYSPALDLSSYGKTLELAQKNFEEAVGIFLEELLDKGTLKEELLSLGWDIDKKNKTVTPPLVIEHSLTKVQIPSVVYA